MEIVRTVAGLQSAQKSMRGEIGFVPTMGALHAGHLSLIRRAVEESDQVIVSIFVNPTQFLEGEDLESYPKREEADRRICEVAGVDILFMPTIEQMYEEDELSIGAPALRGYILEGEKRPGHFDGMLQVVMKLLNLSSATRAYFGKKDAQQLALIMQMARSYFLSCQIIPCEIIRDERGLALSSRNAYLSVDEKEQALLLSRSLKFATKSVMIGERDSATLIEQIEGLLREVDSIEYIVIVDRDFHKIDRVEIGNTMILVAAWVGRTRLIDNIWI
ncbi:MAG: pantoate--beta-alanine ligase [Campylobacterota bacterium]|nr:pantoate--beta-alanine ligase [Campylobacterota bacterium]